MEGGPWYATREMVKGASDVKETAGLNAAIDRNLERCAREAESLLAWTHFYPIVTTRYFDWPNRQYGEPWNLWLDGNPLHSLTAATSGGDALTIASDLFLEPSNGVLPYTCVRINSAGQASWNSGASNFQRAIALTGLWSHGNRTQSAGVLESAIADAVTTTVDVTNSAVLGVGDLAVIENERMIVRDRQLIDTGVNSSGALTNEKSARTLAVPSGAAFAQRETITIDAETMRIDSIAGNNLIVTRAWDGSTLAAHNTNSDIYAPRRLTVERGFGGTTAAAHADATAVSRWIPPLSLTELVLAETQNAIAQENSAWARVIGVNEAEREVFARGLKDLRATVRRTLGRSHRKAAI